MIRKELCDYCGKVEVIHTLTESFCANHNCGYMTDMDGFEVKFCYRGTSFHRTEICDPLSVKWGYVVDDIPCTSVESDLLEKAWKASRE